MLDRGRGAVVFVSSFAGRMATWRHTAYAASKFAMTGFAEALYQEVKSKGVHVGVVYPGVIRTEIFEKGAEFDHLRHVVEPNLVGTDVVTQTIARLIERETFEAFAPAKYGIVWKLRALFPSAVLRGQLAFVKRVMEKGPVAAGSAIPDRKT
jgi:short-subunit dehydrogenase